jgi:hypothetical protein
MVRVWILIGFGLVLMTFVVVRRWRFANSVRDLGWVTEQWLAEHRADYRSRSQ